MRVTHTLDDYDDELRRNIKLRRAIGAEKLRKQNQELQRELDRIRENEGADRPFRGRERIYPLHKEWAGRTWDMHKPVYAGRRPEGTLMAAAA